MINTKIKDFAAVSLGRRGGLATLKKHGKKHFKRMSKLRKVALPLRSGGSKEKEK